MLEPRVLEEKKLHNEKNKNCFGMNKNIPFNKLFQKIQIFHHKLENIMGTK